MRTSRSGSSVWASLSTTAIAATSAGSCGGPMSVVQVGGPALHRGRSGIRGGGCPAALPGTGGGASRSARKLIRWHRDLLRRRARRSLAPTGRPPLDPWVKELILRLGGSTRGGVPQDQRRAPEARGRHLGDDHPHGASEGRPRLGTTPGRPDLDPVPFGFRRRPRSPVQDPHLGSNPGSPALSSASRRDAQDLAQLHGERLGLSSPAV
jgi:hypothetical protein